VGPLFSESSEEYKIVGYGAESRELLEIAKSIRTFAEQHRDTDVETRIQNALDQATLVVFLGFGFHQQNLALLKPNTPGTRRPNVQDVLGTVLGIDEHNHPALQTQLLELGLVGNRPSMLLARTASRLISDLRPRIMMVAG
jgi:hypothetical protein